MIDFTTTSAALAGFPGSGSVDVRPRCAVLADTPLAGYATAVPAPAVAALRRAPEAFTAPSQGTGLPVAGPGFGRTPTVVDVVTRELAAPEPTQQKTDITHTDVPTTLGIHTPGRPQS